MGGLCSKDTVTGDGGGGGGGGPLGAREQSGASRNGGGTLGGFSSSLPSTPSQTRRESERRGLRQGLVHERKHTSVWDVYEVVREVGHGMTGKVYQVRQKLTHDVYALKCMEMRRIDPELLEDLRNEIELLKVMDHPNVIKMYEYYEDDRNIYLILEFCDGGELFDRLHMQTGSRYSETEAARLVFKMCAAIGYCHYMGISHRDLKLENFIFESKEADANIKLIDFGLSAKYGSSIRRMHTMVGTAYYIAPEVLNQADGSTAGYTNACDCWSIGVIAYMLLSGTPPFKGRRDREVLQAVRRGKYTLSGPKWEHVSDEAKDFIRHLLVFNPAKRMTAEQSLKHPWLQRAKREAEARPLDPEILDNLRDFAKLSYFKRAALEAIAFTMSAPSIKHLREQFVKLDNDNSGFVSLSDFCITLQECGMSQEEAMRIFEGIDYDRSNSISYTEFLAASLSRRLWLSRERMRDAFQRLDVDGKGFITKDNLKELLGDDWTAERVEIMMREADSKSDGRIDFEEFMAVMTRESKDVIKDVLPAGGTALSPVTSLDGVSLDTESRAGSTPMASGSESVYPHDLSAPRAHAGAGAASGGAAAAGSSDGAPLRVPAMPASGAAAASAAAAAVAVAPTARGHAAVHVDDVKLGGLTDAAPAPAVLPVDAVTAPPAGVSSAPVASPSISSSGAGAIPPRSTAAACARDDVSDVTAGVLPASAKHAPLASDAGTALSSPATASITAATRATSPSSHLLTESVRSKDVGHVRSSSVGPTSRMSNMSASPASHTAPSSVGFDLPPTSGVPVSPVATASGATIHAPRSSSNSSSIGRATAQLAAGLRAVLSSAASGTSQPLLTGKTRGKSLETEEGSNSPYVHEAITADGSSTLTAGSTVDVSASSTAPEGNAQSRACLPSSMLPSPSHAFSHPGSTATAAVSTGRATRI